MSIIIIYLIGVVLSYMRINAFEEWHKKYGIKKEYKAIIGFTLTSWIGFLVWGLFYVLYKYPGEKFFKL